VFSNIYSIIILYCLFLSSNELDERSYATKRSSVNHRTYINPSIRRDKERSFSSCKYQILFFFEKLIFYLFIKDLREYTSDFKDIEDDWKNAENVCKIDLNFFLLINLRKKNLDA